MSYNPFEVPENLDVKAGEVSATIILADRGKRFTGAFVDGILAGGVALGAQFATGMLSKLSAGIGQHHGSAAAKPDRRWCVFADARLPAGQTRTNSRKMAGWDTNCRRQNARTAAVHSRLHHSLPLADTAGSDRDFRPTRPGRADERYRRLYQSPGLAADLWQPEMLPA